jgi:glycosyltransferase involved in cell wall biosynthesis
VEITILAGAFLPIPPVRGGAVERIQYHLAQQFAAAGNTVTMVSRRYEGLPKAAIENGVRHKRIWSSDRQLFRPLNFVIDALYTLRAALAVPAGDIVVTNTFFAPFLMPRRAGKIYVHVARTPKGQMSFYSRAARLQGVSHDVADRVRQAAPRLAGRVRCIHNPLADFFFGETPPAPPSSRERIVLYVGRVAREKGLSILVSGFAEALRRLEPVEASRWVLKIIGPHDGASGGDGEDYLKTLQDYAAQAGVACDFVGPIYAPAALAEAYRQSPIFVYPSIAETGETFGMSPLEAMAAGAAVVVSSLTCFEEFAQHDINAMVFDHRGDGAATALGDALTRLMTDDTKADAISAKGREAAEQFRLEAIAQRYLDDFNDLVSDQKS